MSKGKRKSVRIKPSTTSNSQDDNKRIKSDVFIESLEPSARYRSTISPICPKPSSGNGSSLEISSCIQIIQQPPEIWHNQGKGEYQGFKVEIEAKNMPDTVELPIRVRVSLRYENCMVVKNQSILIIKDPPTLYPGKKCVINARITQVSKSHQGQKFRLFFEVEPFNIDNIVYKISPIHTQPIKVLSKPTVQKHKDRCGVKSKVRTREDDGAASVVSWVSRPPPSLTPTFSMPNDELLRWATAAWDLMYKLQSFEIGYERRHNGTSFIMDSSRPIDQCPICNICCPRSMNPMQHKDTCDLNILLKAPVNKDIGQACGEKENETIEKVSKDTLETRREVPIAPASVHEENAHETGYGNMVASELYPGAIPAAPYEASQGNLSRIDFLSLSGVSQYFSQSLWGDYAKILNQSCTGLDITSASNFQLSINDNPILEAKSGPTTERFGADRLQILASIGDERTNASVETKVKYIAKLNYKGCGMPALNSKYRLIGFYLFKQVSGVLIPSIENLVFRTCIGLPEIVHEQVNEVIKDWKIERQTKIQSSCVLHAISDMPNNSLDELKQYLCSHENITEIFPHFSERN